MSEIVRDSASDVLDREQIDLLLSLDEGEGAVLAEVVQEFFSTGDELHARVVSAVGERDLESARRAAHTLKGASANVGAARLAAACSVVEARANETEIEEMVLSLGPLEDEYTQALVALQGLAPGR